MALSNLACEQALYLGDMVKSTCVGELAPMLYLIFKQLGPDGKDGKDGLILLSGGWPI